MLKIHMFSSADKVAGQGVGSAYLELLRLLKNYYSDEFAVAINDYGPAQISHFHTIDPRFYLATFSKKRGRKIGYVHFLPETLEGSLKIPQPFKGLFFRYLISFYKRMDELVVVNPSFIEKLVAAGIPEDKVTYIPNFVAKSEFYEQTPEQKRQFREKIGLKPTDFVVFGDGQVQERKGVRDFVKLAQQNPTLKFIWAGGFSFGRMTDGYSDFKKMIDKPPANLTFTGIVDRQALVSYYNAADLFLLPSYDELFPMSVLEAFSCGTPVLLRDLSLYQAIITGYYAAASDVTQMQAQILELQAHPEQLAQLKRAAQKGAQDYSEDHLAQIWHDFYLAQAKLA